MEIVRTIFFHCWSDGGDARCILQLSVIESFSIGWMEPVASLLVASLQMLAKLSLIYFQNGLHCKRPIGQQITDDTETPLGGIQKKIVPGINLRSASLRSGALCTMQPAAGSCYSDHTAGCVTRVRTERNWCLDQ